MQRRGSMMHDPIDPLPIRRRLTVLRDGSTRVSNLVFCERQRQSVSLARCETCRFAGAIVRDREGLESTIGCSQFTLPTSQSSGVPAPPPSGPRLSGACVSSVAAALPVGLSLVRRAVCVSYDAPLRVVARALELEASGYGVTVVDDQDRLLGILPRATATLALLESGAEAVAEHMTVEWSVVEEGETLGEAFSTMTSRRARELSVVGPGRALVGTLRDIDALRFVSYVSRTGLRPPVERAA